MPQDTHTLWKFKPKARFFSRQRDTHTHSKILKYRTKKATKYMDDPEGKDSPKCTSKFTIFKDVWSVALTIFEKIKKGKNQHYMNFCNFIQCHGIF